MIHKKDILDMARGIVRHDQGYRQQRLMYADREWTFILVFAIVSFVLCAFFATRLYLDLQAQVTTDTPVFIKKVQYEEERTQTVLEVYSNREARFNALRASGVSVVSPAMGEASTTESVSDDRQASSTVQVPPIEVLIQDRFPEKIVYGETSGAFSEDEVRIHCENEGGTFNTCGSVCPATAEFCTEQCALTCEFEVGE